MSAQSPDAPPFAPTAPPTAADAALRYAFGHSSLGPVLVACSPRGLRALTLGDDPATMLDALRTRFPSAPLHEDPAALANWLPALQQLIEHPAKPVALPGLPLDPCGTPFQLRVWSALQRIPAGQTISYTALAQRIGAPRSARAVARACAANALAILIPCHRVLRSDGGISGYRWGVARKQALLARERTDNAPAITA